MCYSRELYCFCCARFVKVLTVNQCKRPICEKTVFPKPDTKCDDCSDCETKCTKIRKFPRSWIQRFDVYISRIDAIDGRLVLFLFSESKYILSTSALDLAPTLTFTLFSLTKLTFKAQFKWLLLSNLHN